MIDNFQSFYKKQKLFTDVSKILLAVSGGVDSMVMIHLMQEAKLNIGIAHCNFQLREEESNADEKLVEESAFRFGIEYFVKRFETIDFSNKNKIPIQQAARKLRYEWFDELLENKGYEILATAHHASDQTETIFYNLAKGCGISGLRGIPVKNENVVRPLLFATQDQILDYAAKNKIEWREDKSNFDRKYARNLIRHSIIPELKIINSGLDKTMLRNSMRYSSIEELIIDKKEEILSRYLRSEEADDILSLNWLEDTPGSFILLEEILKEYGFNFDQVSKIYDAKNQAGKVFNSKKFQLTVDRGGVYLSLIKAQAFHEIEVNNFDQSIEFGGFRLSFKKVPKDDFEVISDQRFACIDLDNIEAPIKIRTWRIGDRFFPLGMERKKKLSDFMIDQKIPLNLKKSVCLLESNNQIVWVIGHRIDDRFKVTAKTKDILIAELQKC